MAAQWNKDNLYELVRSKLGDRLFIVVSNREPYVHTFDGGAVKWHRPVSGLTEALDPVMRASGGTWVAQGSGDADRRIVDKNDRVAVPPDKPAYTLRRVWLTDEDVAGFYLGFANSMLWPLCHITFTPPVFNENNWYTYQKVNRIFAEAVLEEISGRQAVVLVQDYHFALLSRYLKEKNPRLTVGQFWHIPWPPYEVWRTCPWHEEILEGMLGNDLLGFHTRSFCRNFIESVKRIGIEADTKSFKITRQGQSTAVAPFPISVDFASINAQAGAEAVTKEMTSLRREYQLDGKYVGIGVDRLDYTKGIPERLRALDRFLGANPEYRGKIVLIEAGMPSRTEIDAYKNISRKIDELTESINARYSAGPYRPVITLNRQLTPVTLNALRRLANFCVVSSLHDGMNLVAKEFVSARGDGDGVLILSRFAGAAGELSDALLINPFDVSEFAGKIKEAIEMPEAERRRRMKNMRQIVARNNIYRWGAAMVSRLIEIAEP
ncbi:MAG: trehalose-6-phosphate synthase [Dehalococcoidales bacterium]